MKPSQRHEHTKQGSRKGSESTIIADQLKTILDHMSGIVYVADMETYEILYANQETRDRFNDVVGKICWQTLQSGQTGPCEFCSNPKLIDSDGKPTGFYKWEVQNTVNHRWYDVLDRALNWHDGRLVRLCESIDITDRKKAEEELSQYKEELEMRVADRTVELQETSGQLQRELTAHEQAEEDLRRNIDKLRRTLAGIIKTLTLTLESRDPYTAGHQLRVSDLARAIADEMGLEKDIVEGIRMAGAIHDLGKINIPAEILSKPGRLTNAERAIIMAHSKIGHDIIEPIEFPWPLAKIILQHHEKVDGSGYPHGLTGKDIMIEARILCVADVVEAASSHRPYRPELGIDFALDEISKNNGILYDSEVVKSCIKLFKEKNYKLKTPLWQKGDSSLRD